MSNRTNSVEFNAGADDRGHPPRLVSKTHKAQPGFIKHHRRATSILIALAFTFLACSGKKSDGIATTHPKDTAVEAEAADKAQAEDCILSAVDNDGNKLFWHIHSDGKEAYADVFDDNGHWQFSQEGTFDGTRLHLTGHSIIGGISTLDVRRTGDRFRGQQYIEDEGEKDVEDMELKVLEAAHPCNGHDINFDIISTCYLSPYNMVYRPHPSQYARLDLDGDHIEETLWVRNGNGTESGAFFLFDPRSGKTAFLTPKGHQVEAFFQGNVITAIEQGVEGSYTQKHFVIEDSRIAREIEVVSEYNGMTGEMDTSYSDLTNDKSLSESEYNAFVDELDAKGHEVTPSWKPFPAKN